MERCFDGATPQERLDAIGQLHGIMSAAHRQLLALVAACDRQGDFRVDGATSTAAWLSAHLGIGASTGRQWVEAAEALEHLPAIAAAYGQGRLSWDQLWPLLRLATRETDAEWAERAPALSPAELTAVARRQRPPASDDVAANHRGRYVRFGEGDPGMTKLFANMPTERAATLRTLLERVAADVPPDPATGYEPLPARMADALGDLAEQGLAADADTERATVVVHYRPDGEWAELDGQALSLETVRRLACGARIQAVGEDAQGRPIVVGRKQRLFTPWQRRHIRQRDGRCRFPGCHRKVFLKYHHIDEYGHGGCTDTWNGVALCHYHHRLVHEGGWRIRGDPDKELTFHYPNGVAYRPGPSPVRPEVLQRIFGTATSAGP